jgi:hypothetical protein
MLLSINKHRRRDNIEEEFEKLYITICSAHASKTEPF